jgi:hypothetical protein
MNVRFVAWDSRSESIGPLHCEAGLTDLRWIRGSDTGELRSHVVNDEKVAVRAVVVAQAEIGAGG